jgi:hypothetical protein
MDQEWRGANLYYAAAGGLKGQPRDRRRGKGISELERGRRGPRFREQGLVGQIVIVRNPLFPGLGGIKDWKETLRANKRRKEKHERDKHLACAFISKHFDESIEDKIVIMNDKDLDDILFLWIACRDIATGVGAQSAGIALLSSSCLMTSGASILKRLKTLKEGSDAITSRRSSCRGCFGTQFS